MRFTYTPRLRSIALLALLALIALLNISPAAPAQSVAAQGAPALIWPIAGREDPTFISDPFAPRLQESKNNRYDWHRGIDIPAPCDTPVRAAAGGTVTVFGVGSTGFSDLTVRINHGNNFHTIYTHLNSVPANITTGTVVTQSTIIGYSGESENGLDGGCAANNGKFDHLHFEVRNGGATQRFAVNPLGFLNYTNSGAPTFTATAAGEPAELNGDDTRMAVDVTASVPDTELDLNEIRVQVFTDAGVLMDDQRFNINQWTLNFTQGSSGTSNVAILDTANDYDGVYDRNYSGFDPIANNLYGFTVSPQLFNVNSTNYTIGVRFWNLNANAYVGFWRIEVSATDVRGNTTTQQLILNPWM